MSSENFDSEALEREIEENPCNIRALSDLGQHYAYKGDYTSALRYYEKIVRINEDNARAWTALGHCYLLKQDFSKCINSYQKSLFNKEESTNAFLWYGIAMLYFTIDEWVQARKLFQGILDSKSEFLVKNDLYFKLGTISIREKSYQDAAENLEKALEFPETPSHKKIDILLCLAEAYSQLNNTQKLNEIYEEALKIDSDSIKAAKFYAWDLFTRNMFDESLGILNKSIEKGKNTSELQYLIARCYHVKKDKEKAREAYSKALSMHSDSCIYWASAGIMYADAEQYSDAFDCFSKANGIFQESWEVWNNIGLLYEILNQKNEAELAFTRARLYYKNDPLPKVFKHPSFYISEPIYKQPKEDMKVRLGPELQMQLDRVITKELDKIFEGMKCVEKKTEEKVPEIVVPKVSNAPVRPDRPQRPENPVGVRPNPPVQIGPQIASPQITHPQVSNHIPNGQIPHQPINSQQMVNPQMAMLQSLMMNPMFLYQMMLNSSMNNMNRATVKEEKPASTGFTRVPIKDENTSQPTIVNGFNRVLVKDGLNTTPGSGFTRIVTREDLQGSVFNRPQVKEESTGDSASHDHEQVAKALIELTEDSLRKKRKNSTDPEDPMKKPKDSDN